MIDSQPNLPRTVLGALFIGGLIASSFWILRPFLPATVWATIGVATWPVMLRVQKWLWGRRSLAVLVMVLLLLVAFFFPLLIAFNSVVDNVETITGWVKSLTSVAIPSPPGWVERVPLVGQRIATAWQEVAASGPEGLAARIAPYEEQATRWILAQLGGVGARMLEFVLTVIVAAILYASGEEATAHLRRFARRLAGEQGDAAVILAGQAIRGVALGVIVTALVQAILSGLGLAVAGVPFAVVLTAIMFLLCIVQVGPLPVLAICVGWLYWKDETGWAIALAVWTVLVGRIDGVLLPILIKRGLDVSLVIVLVGVVGGLFAFGAIGLFVGPVVLAVSYRLLDAWASHGTDAGATPPNQAAPKPESGGAKLSAVQSPVNPGA